MKITQADALGIYLISLYIEDNFKDDNLGDLPERIEKEYPFETKRLRHFQYETMRNLAQMTIDELSEEDKQFIKENYNE